MFKNIILWQSKLMRQGSFLNEVVQSVYRTSCSKYFVNKCSVRSPFNGNGQVFRGFHIFEPCRKGEDRRVMYASLPARDEGTQGEKGVDIDSSVNSREDVFPDENTPTRLFGGVPFRDIPICNIKASKNNTIISVTNARGKVTMIRSCGIEGFKNTRKGTNIAAQATAISISTKALEHGYKSLRVRVQGLGPGRMSAIKGLQMGGMDIISVTDNTPVSWNPPRARKRRKL